MPHTQFSKLAYSTGQLPGHRPNMDHLVSFGCAGSAGWGREVTPSMGDQPAAADAGCLVLKPPMFTMAEAGTLTP